MDTYFDAIGLSPAKRNSLNIRQKDSNGVKRRVVAQHKERYTKGSLCTPSLRRAIFPDEDQFQEYHNNNNHNKNAGQTFSSFVSGYIPFDDKNKEFIYAQPIGDWKISHISFVEDIIEYLVGFFLPQKVKLLPPLNILFQ